MKGEFPLSFLNPRFRSLRSWKKTARGKLLELLHYVPPTCDPAVETVERVDCGDYFRELVRFNTTPDVRVPAFVLVPKNTPNARPPLWRCTTTADSISGARRRLSSCQASIRCWAISEKTCLTCGQVVRGDISLAPIRQGSGTSPRESSLSSRRLLCGERKRELSHVEIHQPRFCSGRQFLAFGSSPDPIATNDLVYSVWMLSAGEGDSIPPFHDTFGLLALIYLMNQVRGVVYQPHPSTTIVISAV